MYNLVLSNRFKKSYKKALKRGLNKEVFENALSLLVQDGRLPKEYLPHELKGDFKGIWECHIQNDWLLLWKRWDITLTIMLIDTGTHSDIFE
jgi:mRNA interferase YafQ